MSQNRSSAVMQQRKEPNDSLDYFPTPPWATRALCEYLNTIGPVEQETVWEPACGAGHMALPLSEYFSKVYASDAHDYGFPGSSIVHDFIGIVPSPWRADWIITNPPFRLAEQFALRALVEAKGGVALLVRSAFLESSGRFKRLFQPHPPSAVLQFVERVPMIKGRLDRESSTATAYCWLVWELPEVNATTRFEWLPPCRMRLEQAGDYEVAA